MKTDVAGLKTSVTDLNAKVADVDRHMRVLHENAMGRLAAFSEQPLATKAEMNQGFARLERLFTLRVEPLEAAVRRLSLARKPRNTRG